MKIESLVSEESSYFSHYSHKIVGQNYISFTVCVTKKYNHQFGCNKQIVAQTAHFELQSSNKWAIEETIWFHLIVVIKFYDLQEMFQILCVPVFQFMLLFACLLFLIFHLFPESFLCNILHVPIHLSVDLSETNSTANGYGFSNTYSVGIIFQTISRYIPIPLANHYQLILINYLLQHINE